MMRYRLVVLYLLLLTPGAFAADEEAKEAASTWNDYKVVAERNIFNRYRTGAVTATRQQQVAVASEQSYYTLRGITRQSDGYVSFIENTRNAGVTRLKKGDTVAEGKITAITMDGITYEYGEKTIDVEIGMNLEGNALSSGSQSYASGSSQTGFSEMGQMPGMGQQSQQGGMGQMPGMGQLSQGGMGQMPGMGQQSQQGGMGQMPGMGQQSQQSQGGMGQMPGMDQSQMSDQSQGRGSQGPGGGMGQFQSSGQTGGQSQQNGQQQGQGQRQNTGQSVSTGQSAATGQSQQSTRQATTTVQGGQTTNQSVTAAGEDESSEDILERLKERRKKELE